MSAAGRTEHRRAGHVTADWIGRRVTVTTSRGTVTGALSDFWPGPALIHLFVAGLWVRVSPRTTVTVDELGILGGAS